MNARECGFLLMTSRLGDPARKVLTVPQFRILARAVTSSGITRREGEVGIAELMELGFAESTAQQILQLLSENELLFRYLHRGTQKDCFVLTRVTEGYPGRLRARLGLDSPGCLWLKGDPTLLQTPAISLVGCRDLKEKNRDFARQVGAQAAQQGLTLISGNARGADTEAQEACLDVGGKVISVVADRLENYPLRRNVLYVTEDGYDLDFTTQRALSRNRVIHALGNAVFVAQAHYGRGGTWDGTVKNLRGKWSPVFCMDDGSKGVREMLQMGAKSITAIELGDLRSLIVE